MPQVSVNDCAYIDARLRLAGKQLRINHERLGWRLLQVWSQVTARESLIMPTALVGATIGKLADDVAQAFIAAQLAERVGEDTDLLDLSPLQTMFGERDWPPKETETSPAGQNCATDSECASRANTEDDADIQPHTDENVELVPLDREESEPEEIIVTVREPYNVRYWILSRGETAEDARTALVCSHGPTSDEDPCIGCKLRKVKVAMPPRHAEMCAQHYHETHGSEDADWPMDIATQMCIGFSKDPVYEHTVRMEHVPEHDIDLFNAAPRQSAREQRNDDLIRLGRSVGK